MEEDEPIARRTRSKRADPAPPPRVEPSASAPRVEPTPIREPIARRTRARTRKGSPAAKLVGLFGLLASAAVAACSAAAPPRRRVQPTPAAPAELIVDYVDVPPPPVSAIAAASRNYPSALLQHLAFPVIDQETGKVLEYRHLKKHPKLGATWRHSYSNEMGRLCQGVGTGDKGPRKQRVAGTDTFRVINYDNIPADRRKEIAHVRVVCEVRPQKADPDRTRITVSGGGIKFPGDVGTPTASLDLVKLIINSVLSRPGAKFACYDAANFYLETPEMERKEYVRIKYDDIPDEFRKEYDLPRYVRKGWVFFEVVRGAYGLPQSGKIANDLLRKRLNAAGYHETSTTPGLWRHTWRPIQFVLIVDDFGVEYVGKQHADHLLSVLNKFYKMSEDWEGKKIAGIDITWDYAEKHADRTCRLSMDGYIHDLLFREGHPPPAKPQHSPHKHREIIYGAKQQFARPDDDSPPLNDKGKTRVQRIVGALLYYARATDPKLLVPLSAIGTQQAAPTEATAAAVSQLLDYVATYPADGITYRASAMVLCAHSDAGFANESKSRSRAGCHIFLSEDESRPRWNGGVLTIASIMKNVLTSAAEAELSAIFECAKAMVPIRQALIEMGWPQGKSPIQTDNSTANGVVNKTIVPKKLKSMDLRLHWLRCREAQGQFRFYWAPGVENWGDYYTKHHPPIHHLAQRPIHVGGMLAKEVGANPNPPTYAYLVHFC